MRRIMTIKPRRSATGAWITTGARVYQSDVDGTISMVSEVDDAGDNVGIILHTEDYIALGELIAGVKT